MKLKYIPIIWDAIRNCCADAEEVSPLYALYFSPRDISKLTESVANALQNSDEKSNEEFEALLLKRVQEAARETVERLWMGNGRKVVPNIYGEEI